MSTDCTSSPAAEPPSSPSPSVPLSPMSSIRALMCQTAQSNPPPQVAGTPHLFSEVDSNDTDDINDQHVFSVDPLLISGSIPSVLEAYTQVVLTHIHNLKMQKNLSGDALRDLEAFETGLSPAEHMAHIMIIQLEIHDQLRLLALAQDYCVPETVKTTAKDYAAVYVLSPFIVHYKDKNSPGDVLVAMCQLNVQNLPPASETGRCSLILEIIKKAMTDTRHNMKDKIAASISNGNQGAQQDIATLTRACIGTSKAKPTAALFIRITVIRHLYITLPKNITPEKFWDKVDKYLTKCRQEYSQPGALHEMFTMVYNCDISTYGQPDLTNHPQVLAQEVEDWITKVNAIASRTRSNT